MFIRKPKIQKWKVGMTSKKKVLDSQENESNFITSISKKD